jgi:hypothetical protein
VAFQSEDELDAWLLSHTYPRGAVVAPQALYDLGLAWYATRLDLDFEPATMQTAEAMFMAHGLTGEFWSFDG